MSRINKRVVISITFITLMVFTSSYGNMIALGSAWNKGSTIENPLIAISGGAAELNGSLDAGWEYVWGLANTSIETLSGPEIEIKISTMIYSNYFYLRTGVQRNSHSPDEYLRLLISNSTDSAKVDFLDAKLIQNRNFTSGVSENQYNENHTIVYSDQYYDGNDYVNDSLSTIDFSGSSNITFDKTDKYSYYEYKIPLIIQGASLKEQDSSLNATATYAFKVQYGYNQTIEDGGAFTCYNSSVIMIQVGEKISGGDDYIGIFNFEQYVDIIANSFFIVTLIAFIGLGFMTFQARTKID